MNKLSLQILLTAFNRAIVSFPIRMFFAVDTCRNRFTHSTNPSAFGISIAMLNKSVAASTMRFPKINCSVSNATQDVSTTRHRLQMVWIDAKSISTKMINLHSFRDRAGKNFVGNTVSKIRSLITAYPKLAVAALQDGRLPNPARFGLFKFLGKSLYYIAFLFWHSKPTFAGYLPQNMGVAQ